MNFFDKLVSAIECNQSLLYAPLDPDPEVVSDGKMAQWLEFAIAQTSPFICAYKLNLGFYQALGVFGLELLKQTLRAIPANIPTILDAQCSDLKTSTVLARSLFEDWQVDACTVLPYAGTEQVAPFLVYPDKAVFIVMETEFIQETGCLSGIIERSLAWASPQQLGLKVNAPTPDILRRIRAIAPERVILLQAIGSDHTKLMQLLSAGLNAEAQGLLIPISTALLTDENSGDRIRDLRERVNQHRQQAIPENPTCDLWLPNVCFLNSEPKRDLILQLFDIGCIIFGEHVQSSGAIFPYYIDLRTIISKPQIFHQIVQAYAEILQTLEFDRIAGIPYGSLPTATGLALRLERPMIFPRKEVKNYGTKRVIEGHFQPGEKVVVVDDILISGKSVMQGAEKLKSAGLEVEDIVVLIDHGNGVTNRLQENGYRGHAVLTISEIADTLYQAGRINTEEFKLFVNSDLAP